jgi:hypothetical protein
MRANSVVFENFWGNLVCKKSFLPSLSGLEPLRNIDPPMNWWAILFRRFAAAEEDLAS